MRLGRKQKAVGDRPLRVAQICGTANGARWMVQIAEGLEREGYEVVAIIGGDDGDTAVNLARAGIPYAVLPHALVNRGRVGRWISTLPYGLSRLRHLGDGVTLARTVLAMARLLRRMRIDIVHTHIFHSILVGRFAAALARVPVRIAMVPGPLHLESATLRRLDIATSRLDHRIVAGSRWTESIYAKAGVPASRLTHVHYGADPGDFDPGRADGRRVRDELGLSDGAPLIGQVAHFYPVPEGRHMPAITRGLGVKGHADHVDAACIVLRRRPDARFVFVGSGWGPDGERHREAVSERIRALGVEHAVWMLGPRDDVPDVLAALDISVQCSLTENYGGTIESLLMQRPTIATRVGGMPEVVQHERTGLLVEPRDPEQLAAAMLRLIDDRELAERLASTGRELVVDQFTTAACVRGVARVYREVARERRLVRPPLLGEA